MKTKELKQRHDEYIQNRIHGWDGQKMRETYTKEDLILHLLLESEVFYVWSQDTTGRALSYAQDAYPDTTLNDLRKVYYDNVETVKQIYG